MIICQVDAILSGMDKEDIEQELQLVGDVLEALEGELLCAEVRTDQNSFVAYVCAESELVVSDIFDACCFTVEQILYLGPAHETHIDCNRSSSQLTWQYRPARAAITPARVHAPLPHPPLHGGQSQRLSAR